MVTVPQQTRAVSYTLAASSAGPFDVGFRLFDATGILVYADDVLIEGWTLTGDFSTGYSDDARVTLPAAQDSGTIITIRGNNPISRDASYANTEPRLADKLNLELAEYVAILQEIKEFGSNANVVIGAGGYDFPDVEAMIDTINGYDSGRFGVGDRFSAGPYQFEVLGSASENPYLTAASGLKASLVREGNLKVTLSSTGAIDNGVAGGDSTAFFNRAVEYLGENGGGTLVVDVAKYGNGYYFNGNMKVAHSNVRVVWEAEAIYGANARLAFQGKLVEEQDALGDGSYFLIRATSGAGETFPRRIYLSNAEGSKADEFTVGQLIVLRGENDANGVAIETEKRFVTSVVTGTGADLTTNYIEVDADLTYTYEPTYPDSEQPEGTDVTTIGVMVASKLASDAARGATQITVADASDFAVGDWLHIEDEATIDRWDTTTSAIVTSTNQSHLQMVQVTAVDTGTDVITLNTPLRHSFTTAENAVAIKAAPIIGCANLGMRVQFAALPADLNRWVVWASFTILSDFERPEVLSFPNLTAGHTTHLTRIGEGCFGNSVDKWKAVNGKGYGGGQVYGVTLYKGAYGNIVSNGYADGMRHSVLEFMGAGDNLIVGNVSRNCWNSDFDAHNGGEGGSLYIGNTVVYGPNVAPDTTIKSAFRIGNPAHIEGTRNVTMMGNKVYGFPTPHVAFDIQPPAEMPMMKGNVAVDCATMFRVQYNARGDAVADPDKATMQALAITDAVIEQNTMIGGERFLQVDGGPARSVSRLVSTDNKILRATNNQTQYRVYRTADTTIIEDKSLKTQAGSATDLMDLNDNTGLRVVGFALDGANKVARMEDCPSAVVEGLTAANVSSTQVLVDEGGNTDMQFVDYRAHGFVPTVLDNAVSTGRVIRRALHQTASDFGLTLLEDADAATARATLGLGNAATETVQSSATDTTAARLLAVGAFGAGAAAGTYLFGRANVLGTVSQASGVPTGAIIQRGSGASGSFIRFADGTQICVHSMTAGSAKALGDGSYGNPWRTADFSWTFGAAFAVAPTVTGVVSGDDNGAGRHHGLTTRYVTTTGITSATLIRLSGGTVDLTPTVYLTAVGRWF